MATSLSTARRALRSLGDRGRTTRIPEDVRALVLAYADEGRAGGESWHWAPALAVELRGPRPGYGATHPSCPLPRGI